MAKVYSRRIGAERPRRRRDAAATRAAILESARREFAKAGYDGAGVRDIAKGAGVTAMLVNRYFGSKEQLFAEVLAGIQKTPFILTKENLTSSTRGRDMAQVLVELTKTGATPLDGFRIMFHSASSHRAAQIGKKQIEAHYLKVLTAALEGEHAAERAGLVLALVAGVQVMRQMMGLGALAKADPDVLVKLLGPLFQQLMA